MGLGQVGNMMGQGSSANALNYNANSLQNQGVSAIDQGATAMQIQANKAAQVVGTAKADVGASGTTLDNGGSSGKIVAQDAQMGALDTAQINANAQRTAWGFDTQATLARAQAEAAQKSADLSKGLLTGSTLAGAAWSGVEAYGMYAAVLA
jgi:hypothetical protein